MPAGNNGSPAWILAVQAVAAGRNGAAADWDCEAWHGIDGLAAAGRSIDVDGGLAVSWRSWLGRQRVQHGGDGSWALMVAARRHEEMERQSRWI
ncbi:hypothetical protein M0R45_026123 [Rubus argutus]|uniref:MHC class I antigen n=1 Tax=Rubus argutus TaxID=59490 RepID=A0AAW1WYE5_RUBAR